MKLVALIVGTMVWTCVLVLVNCERSVGAGDEVDNDRLIQLCSSYLGREIDPEARERMSVARVDNPSDMQFLKIAESSPTSIVKVSLSEFPLDFAWDESGNLKDWFRNWEIYVDEENMRLVKAITTTADWEDRTGRTPEEVLELDSKLLEKKTRFVEYPDSVGVSLVEALRSCPHSPQLASYLSARFIRQRIPGSDSLQTVWAICLIDMPPVRVPGRSHTPETKRMSDFALVILDGCTGAYIRSGN